MQWLHGLHVWNTFLKILFQFSTTPLKSSCEVQTLAAENMLLQQETQLLQARLVRLHLAQLTLVHTCDTMASTSTTNFDMSNANTSRMRYTWAFHDPKMVVILFPESTLLALDQQSGNEDSGSEIKDGREGCHLGLNLNCKGME